jgi:hypothetical protein
MLMLNEFRLEGTTMDGKHEYESVTEWERAVVERTNASDATPVVFVHGLWLLPGSWDGWRKTLEDNGYVTLAPGWSDTYTYRPRESR